MDSTMRDAIATRLAQAWSTRVPIARLAAEERPQTEEEALDIQDRVVQLIGGWKAGAKRPIKGAIFASAIHASPARVPSRFLHLQVIEGEVAFLFEREMPPRTEEYSREEVAACVSACPAIEIVDSRYSDFPGAGDLERLGDLLSSGAFVYGPPLRDWAHLDLGRIAVELTIDDRVVVSREGGHVTGDPLLACVMLVNAARTGAGITAGRIVTAGTYTGALKLPAGSTARVRFDGLGAAEVTFTI